jgi:hypothetical protein
MFAIQKHALYGSISVPFFIHTRLQQKNNCSLLIFWGAESDSDAPPDERAPAFFVNEDGTKAGDGYELRAAGVMDLHVRQCVLYQQLKSGRIHTSLWYSNMACCKIHHLHPFPIHLPSFSYI